MFGQVLCFTSRLSQLTARIYGCTPGLASPHPPLRSGSGSRPAGSPRLGAAGRGRALPPLHLPREWACSCLWQVSGTGWQPAPRHFFKLFFPPIKSLACGQPVPAPLLRNAGMGWAGSRMRRFPPKGQEGEIRPLPSLQRMRLTEEEAVQQALVPRPCLRGGSRQLEVPICPAHPPSGSLGSPAATGSPQILILTCWENPNTHWGGTARTQIPLMLYCWRMFPYVSKNPDSQKVNTRSRSTSRTPWDYFLF